MLAGCSSALLSPRHRLRSEASVQLQTYQFQLQEKHCPAQQKMGTQRLDLPCGFSTRDVPQASLSLEKPSAQARATAGCAFRHNQVTPAASSLAALKPRMLKITEGGNGALWERRRNLKRERSSSEENQAKRSKTDEVPRIVIGGGNGGGIRDEVWFPRCTQESIFLEEQEVEEKVLLVPNAACFPVLTSSTDTLVGSFGTDSDLGASEGPEDKSQSGSSSSSSAHSSSPELNRNGLENKSQNVSGNPYPTSIAAISVGGGEEGEGENAQTQQQGFELVSLVTSCAESISMGNYEGIRFMLTRLGEMASPTRTAIHRVMAYFTEALAIRAVKLWPHIFSVAPPKVITDPADAEEDAIALRALSYANPIPKFIYFSLNERMLRAFEGKDRVHIIDFDIKQGMQWPSLFQGLASRPNPPSHIRITGIGDSRQDLQDAGLRLAMIAEELKLPFEFHAVVDRLEDVRLWMLHVKKDECVAVNCVLVMHKMLYDGNGGALMNLLGLIRSTNPAILLMAEQESKHNEAGWEARFANSLRYYAAIFDSLDYSLPMDSPARIKVEEMFAREIRNIVTCEGIERVERHDSFDRWKKLMEDGGFKSAGIGKREMIQSRMILRMYSGRNYSIDKQGEGEGEGDGITLKWLDQPLYTVSAWIPVNIAGSSSTSQQS